MRISDATRARACARITQVPPHPHTVRRPRLAVLGADTIAELEALPRPADAQPNRGAASPCDARRPPIPRRVAQRLTRGRGHQRPQQAHNTPPHTHTPAHTSQSSLHTIAASHCARPRGTATSRPRHRLRRVSAFRRPAGGTTAAAPPATAGSAFLRRWAEPRAFRVLPRRCGRRRRHGSRAGASRHALLIAAQAVSSSATRWAFSTPPSRWRPP